MLKPVMGDGLLTNEGPSWLLSRRLMQPVFHRAFVAHFAELICEVTSARLESWAEIAKRREAFDIGEEMRSLTLEIVAKALFGVDLEIETFSQAWGTLLDAVIKRIRSPWLPLLGVAAPKNSCRPRAHRRRHDYSGASTGTTTERFAIDLNIVA